MTEELKTFGDWEPGLGLGRAAQEKGRITDLVQAFNERYGVSPDFIARAPGRINLIGDHTDYTGGFVLPVAIDLSMLIAVRAVNLNHRQIELYSRNYHAQSTVDLDNLVSNQEPAESWSNYIRAVAWGLREKGTLDPSLVSSGQFLLDGNVPQASGLSSSAAIEVATGLALFTLAGFVPREIDRVALALACQKGENGFVGVNSGIMDQFISALGQPQSALLIDTRSLEYRVIPLGLDKLNLKIVAVDSAYPRALKSSAYNERRAQCEEATALIAQTLGLPPETQLRDLSLAQLHEAMPVLSPVLLKRARHVISENARVLAAVQYMEQGLGEPANLKAFGALLDQSHASLRDDFEVSIAQVDLLVELAQAQAGVIGARMTGGGFGGCTVNLVEGKALESFQAQVVEEYQRRSGLAAHMYVFEAVEGGQILR